MKKKTSSSHEGISEKQTRKEIEAEWQRLLARADGSPEARPSTLPAGAKVIRRRKGQKDLPVA